MNKIIILFFFSTSFAILSCSNLSSNPGNGSSDEMIKDPKKIVVTWNKNGGMLPERTQIYISNDSCSYFTSKQGVDQLLEYRIPELDLKTLYNVFYTNKFNEIETFHEEIYDRGGSSISLSADTQSFSVSNSGMTLIKENNKEQYAAVEKAILNFNKTQISKQSKTVIIDLDSSIANYSNYVVLYVNGAVEYSEEQNGEYFTLELDLLPMNNKFEIYLLKKDDKDFPVLDKRYEVLLEQLPENNKVLLTLDGDQLIIK